MEGFCSINLVSVPQEHVLTTHSLCGWCGSKLSGWTPRFMATHPYMVVRCLSGSVTSCSQHQFCFWGDTGTCPGLNNMFPFLPGASHTVPWCPGLTNTKQFGLFPFNLSLLPPLLGATDKLILHSFLRKWFASRYLGETLSCCECFLFSKTLSASH